jgi:hypothetical protein
LDLSAIKSVEIRKEHTTQIEYEIRSFHNLANLRRGEVSGVHSEVERMRFRDHPLIILV